MCLIQKFSFSADPVILDLKLQLAGKCDAFDVSFLFSHVFQK